MKKILLLSLITLGLSTAYASNTLKNISIANGNLDQVNSKLLLSDLSSFKGETLNLNLIESVIQNLYSQGIYKNIIVTKTSNNSIQIELQPKAVIVSLNVTLKGYPKIPANKIKSSLSTSGFAVGDVYSEARLNEFTKKLKAYYDQLGYFNVEIHPELTYKTPSEIALSYNIVQNKQARVQSIVIENANKFKSKSLVVQLGMRPDVS
ncbi:MAG: POTRA domain-containing protein, partial [Psittacicella sp.]